MTATTLYEAFPIPVAAAPGAVVTIDSILTAAFGPDEGGFAEYWLAYNGPLVLQNWHFSYWDLSDPTVARWFVNNVDIGPNSNNQQTVSPSQLGTVDLHVGNDIGAFAFITVPSAGTPGNWTEYTQYALLTV